MTTNINDIIKKLPKAQRKRIEARATQLLSYRLKPRSLGLSTMLLEMEREKALKKALREEQ